MTKAATETRYRIGDMASLLGMSADTLRYYEKLGLLPRVGRSGAGLREYGERDVSRLRFIQRAQKMGFSLAEIAHLLAMRENPHLARDEVRILTSVKLEEVEARLKELTLLRDELRLLLNLCRGAKDGCPIIETIGQPSPKKPRGKK
ncbi:MAG: MerR family transcriptional regulator [Hydrogenophilales bacterium]|nr:MerR family transcriptional regulator [Hydrogenophilales bacterium]